MPLETGQDGAYLPRLRSSPPGSGACSLVEAENFNVLALYPWLTLPVVAVILVVLDFNFLGNGLRDEADKCTWGKFLDERRAECLL